MYHAQLKNTQIILVAIAKKFKFSSNCQNSAKSVASRAAQYNEKLLDLCNTKINIPMQWKKTNAFKSNGKLAKLKSSTQRTKRQFVNRRLKVSALKKNN